MLQIIKQFSLYHNRAWFLSLIAFTGGLLLYYSIVCVFLNETSHEILRLTRQAVSFPTVPGEKRLSSTHLR